MMGLDKKTKKVIVEVLCSQALADHLGDVRDAEESLWTLIGSTGPLDTDEFWGSSAWGQTKLRLEALEIPLPSNYLEM
jgi:hypothetical protein